MFILVCFLSFGFVIHTMVQYIVIPFAKIKFTLSSKTSQDSQSFLIMMITYEILTQLTFACSNSTIETLKKA